MRQFYGRESLTELAHQAVGQGCDICIAAGGDGTVAGVADALVGTAVPLGIIPLGTGNSLARELGLPLDVEGHAPSLPAATPRSTSM